MTPEKWQNIVADLKDKFKIDEHDTLHIEEYGGTDVEYIIFKSPLGKTKLEFITKPVVLDKKTNYSRRIGSDVNVEYIYSEDEKTYAMKAYTWSEENDDWTEIDTSAFEEDTSEY